MGKFIFLAVSGVCAVTALSGCGDAAFEENPEESENVDSVAGALCTSVQLGSSSPGPLPSGSITALTATGATCAAGETPEYRFLYRRNGGPTALTEFRGWGLSPNANFDNTGLPSGKYTLYVRVRNVGSTKQYDSQATVVRFSGNVCTSVTLGANPASPRPPGTDITLTGTASCTEGAAEYQFLYRPTGTGPYTVLRGWGPASFLWESAGNATGTYTLQVQARGAGNTTTYESQKTLNYSLSDSCAPATLSATPATPQPVGTAVTVTASANCTGGTPEYRFLYRRGANPFIEFRGWGTDNSAPWDTNPLLDGNYTLRVETRAAGISSSQGYKTASFKLTPNPGIVFADPTVEAHVRSLVGIPAGPIPPSAVAPITDLDLTGLGVTSLVGLEHFTSLSSLRAPDNQITSVAPISGLTNLTLIDLAVNQIQGTLEPFAGLTNLVVLQVAVNQLTGDLSPLASLTGLQALSMGDNQLSGTLEPLSSLTSLVSLQGPNNQFTGSLDPLASLASLTNLQMQINQLSGDLSALGAMIQPSYVSVDLNAITIDLAPLVANPNFDNGDILSAQLNPIDCGGQMGNFVELASRGVTVYTDCPF